MAMQFQHHHQIADNHNDTSYDASASEGDIDNEMDVDLRLMYLTRVVSQEFGRDMFAPGYHHKALRLRNPQPRAAREPTQRNLGVATTGYASSDEEAVPRRNAATTSHKKRRVDNHQRQSLEERRTSWPEANGANDSAVQGLSSTENDEQRVRTGEKAKRRRKAVQERILRVVGRKREEEVVLFKGIADADENLECWRDIVLEGHMDRILEAVRLNGPGLDEREEGKVVVAVHEVGGGVFEGGWGEEEDDAHEIPVRKTVPFQRRVRSFLGMFACVGRRKVGGE